MESFRQAQDWLDSLEPRWGVLSGKKKLSLEVVEHFLSKLGNPDRSFDYRVIVGGTAGKGTVARKLAKTLDNEGIKVVCLTSPHLQTRLERIQIGDRLVGREAFAQGILEVKAVTTDLIPTEYEAIVLAGVLCAQKARCQVLIAEVGLGGEFDAVNAFKGVRIGALTFVGDDHREVLGDLPDIARTKARIFTSDSILNLSYEKTYQDILKAEARGPVEFIKGVPSNLHNKMVKRIAREILQNRDFQVAHVKLPARWEKIPETNLILDGAHSLPRFEALIPKIKKLSGPKYAILAMARNHHPESFRCIYDLFDAVVLTQISNNKDQRSNFYTPQELKEYFPEALEAENFEEALKLLDSLIPRFVDSSPMPKILITGSFYFCGQVREHFYPSSLIEEQGTEFPVVDGKPLQY